MAGVPEIGWNVPAKLAMASRWGDDVPLAPSIEDVSERNLRVRQVFAQAMQQPGVFHRPDRRRTLSAKMHRRAQWHATLLR